MHTMKKTFTLTFLAVSGILAAQQNYCDFESVKLTSFAEYNGTLDSAANNPSATGLNTSAKCARYIRDTVAYDNIKLFPYGKLVDVTPYASTAGSAPKIMLKLYTSAPVNSQVELQLGVRSYTSYPAGVHSVYTASTTAQRAWQTLTFMHVVSPSGSLAQANAIDKIVIFFRPGSAVRDTFYFDDPTGPELAPVGLNENTRATVTGLNVGPNPASDKVLVTFDAVSGQRVTVELFDATGKRVKAIDAGTGEGARSLEVATGDLAEGLYFCRVSGDAGLTRKLVVSR
jgi:hypothetical protein